MKNTVMIILLSLIASSCIDSLSLDFVSIKTTGIVTDTAGEFISNNTFELCAEATTGRGEVIKECDSVTTNMDGQFKQTFNFEVAEGVVNYKAYILKEAIQYEAMIDSEIVTNDNISAGSRTLDVTLSFTLPENLISKIRTTFNMSGMVANQESGEFVNEEIKICIYIKTQENAPHRFEQCQTTDTNEFGEYSTSLEIESYYKFQLDNDLIETYVETSTVFGGGSNLIQKIEEDDLTGNRVVTFLASFVPKIPVIQN